MLKRDRERARDEKAARKREDRARRQERDAPGDGGPRVATREELDGYGLPRGASGDPFEDGKG
jgi:hypothetical protein